MKKPTNTEVRRALQGSIAKWNGVSLGLFTDYGVNNCPLCEMFYERHNTITCEGCPVCIDSGEILCRNTPYVQWSIFAGYGYTGDTPKRKRLARKEVAYLKMLDRKFFVKGVTVK